MEQEEICLQKEGTAEGYLGVDITTSIDGHIHLTESKLLLKQHLCQRASTAILPVACGTINYESIAGILLYLSGHTCPYTFSPTKRHEQALVRIGRYLKGTIHDGIRFDPCNDLNLDCYPDADVAGLEKHEHAEDPHCVRSRTGYVVTLAGCPVIWASKLQTEIALSTMEAEYIALSTACGDLFPLMDKLTELTNILDLPFTPGSHMHVHIHEDNVGALTLGKLEPRRMTPRSKHYALNNIFGFGNILVLVILTLSKFHLQTNWEISSPKVSPCMLLKTCKSS